MGVPKANRKKTGFEHWQEGRDQEQTSATDDHAVLQADTAKLARCAARCASPSCLSSLSLTSSPAVHFYTFSAVCICLALLHLRESPDKAHPSSPKIEVIRRHRIYCNNRQASIRLPFARVKKTQQIFPYLWNVAHSVRAKNPIQKAVLRRGQAPWSDKTNTHTHTHTHTKSAGKHFAKYTNHAVQSGFCPNLPNEIAEEPEDGVCACKHPTVQELM
jgi:hypothetical protein